VAIVAVIGSRRLPPVARRGLSSTRVSRRRYDSAGPRHGEALRARRLAVLPAALTELFLRAESVGQRCPEPAARRAARRWAGSARIGGYALSSAMQPENRNAQHPSRWAKRLSRSFQNGIHRESPPAAWQLQARGVVFPLETEYGSHSSLIAQAPWELDAAVELQRRPVCSLSPVQHVFTSEGAYALAVVWAECPGVLPGGTASRHRLG